MNYFVIFCLISIAIIIPLAIREQIRRNRWWKNFDLKEYLDSLNKINCKYCLGEGYEGYTEEGEPTGEFCEHCESYGYVWRAIFPPSWLKHGNIWRQSEIEELHKKIDFGLRHGGR